MTDPSAVQTRPSLAFLASLHPSGDPDSILAVDQLADPAMPASKGDVLVLTLSAVQCGDARRCAETIDRALAALAPGGVLWVEAPGRWRSALMTALGARSMEVGSSYVRRSRGAASTDFSLSPAGLRFALGSGKVSRRWWSVSAVLEHLPLGQAALLRLIPGIGFAAFRPGTIPFAWLTRRFSDPGGVDVALTTNWRGEQAPFLVFAVGQGETLIAKRGGLQCHASIAHEAAMLNRLAEDASRAGLKIPRLIDYSKTSSHSMLVETAVPGRPMAGWIREGRHRDLGSIADRLATWLSRWNSATVRHVEFTTDLCETLILSAPRELAGSITAGAAYRDWLVQTASELIGRKVPLVAAHNDLTMANVLADSSGICSVVDWEAASPDGLPLADYHYAICDAETAIRGGERIAAFRACFLDDGDVRQRLLRAEQPLRAIAGEPPAWLELCFHSGWLRHAANEQARSSRANNSFIEIANLLSLCALDR